MQERGTTDEVDTARRSILGPADVDGATFTTIVAAALGERPADVAVLGTDASVVPYALDAITTAGRYWVSVLAATPSGERRVRMFVKHVQSWSRSPFFQFVPEELRALAEASVPWRTEPLIYETDLRHRLPPGLTMPDALHVAFLDEASAVIWLPALDVVDHDWRTADFARAAFLLGRLAGSPEVAELARVGEPDTGPHTIRTYAGGRLAGQVAPLLRSGDLWRVPWIGEAFDPALRARLLAALDEVPTWVDEVEAAPQTVAHGDACPNNLLRTAGSDEITLIDFGFWGRQGVGFDLGQLLVGDIQIGRRPAATLSEVECAIVPAYLDGLHAEGLEVDESTVARAHALHLMVFTGLSTALMAPPTPDAPPPDPLAVAALAHDARERAAISRFCLDLVEATSGRPGQRLDSVHVSPLRESLERASLPAVTYLSSLPRFVPFLGILVLTFAGILLPSPAWLLLVVVILLLLWILALAWPRLTGAERLMRLAVVAIMVAVLVTQVAPRG